VKRIVGDDGNDGYWLVLVMVTMMVICDGGNDGSNDGNNDVMLFILEEVMHT